MGGIVWLAIAGAIAWVFWVGGINTAWYSVQYHVSPEKIHIDSKPADCDFVTAPLGVKGCHYEAFVMALNASGIRVGGTRPPKYDRDINSGKAIWSDDNGKTWNFFYLPDVPDLTVHKVMVAWVKVKD